MSLELSFSTPKGLEIKTLGLGSQDIFLGDYRIPMQDFLDMAEYVLTNTDLEINDPRSKFLSRLKKVKTAPGWDVNQNPKCRRILIPGQP